MKAVPGTVAVSQPTLTNFPFGWFDS